MLGRVGRRDALFLASLSLVAVGIPMILSAAAGTIGLPHNDDWVYMRAATSLFRSGGADMPGHTAAFIGQLVLVQPLLWLSGGDPWAFTAFGLGMTFVCVASTYLLARRFVEVGSAILVVLLVLAFPGFGRETASFMTDIPAYALAMLCLLLGVIWLQGEGGGVFLVVSIGIGLVAVSIREFAIAAPIAILIAAWARNRADERVLLAGLSGIMVVGIAGILIVAAPAGRLESVIPGLAGWGRLGPAFSTLAAVLLPAIVLGTAQRRAPLSPAPILLGAFLLSVLLVVVFGPGEPLVGTLWWPNGLTGNMVLSGTRGFVIDLAVWLLSGQLALFAAILVVGLVLGGGSATSGGSARLRRL